jgi:hypothetical protein
MEYWNENVLLSRGLLWNQAAVQSEHLFEKENKAHIEHMPEQSEFPRWPSYQYLVSLRRCHLQNLSPRTEDRPLSTLALIPGELVRFDELLPAVLRA